MLSHYAMDPDVFQPHITRPPASSALRVCPDQTATLLSTQLTLLLQPFSTPPPHVQETAKGQQTNRFLCRLPSSAFPAHPLTHSVSGCAGSVGDPFSRPSVCTYWSLCPKTREPIAAGHRKKVKGGSCLCLLFLQGVPVPSVFPQSSIIMLNK